jgi:hypothetical protein
METIEVNAHIPITVYRDSWLHQQTAGVLYRSCDQQMCFIGQLAHQLGVPLASLEDEASLSFLRDAEIPEELSFLLSKGESRWPDSKVADRIIVENDKLDPVGGVEGVEDFIISTMTEHGFSVTFVDGIAPWFSAPWRNQELWLSQELVCA